jgi:hypothetical protein
VLIIAGGVGLSPPAGPLRLLDDKVTAHHLRDAARSCSVWAIPLEIVKRLAADRRRTCATCEGWRSEWGEGRVGAE